MSGNQDKISAGGIVVAMLVILSAIALERGFVLGAKWYRLAWLTIPLLIVTIVMQRKKML
jgi:hypothetical protein